MGKHADLPRHARLLEQLRVVGTVALAAAVFLACGQIKPPPELDHAPASALTLAMVFDDGPRLNGSQFVTMPVELTVSTFSGGHAVTLTSKQKLTVNGVMLSNPAWGEMAAPLDRQPAGGSYDFVYTDEQGHTTTFSVPAIAPLTLISPAPGAAAAIPRPVALIPTPTPGIPPPGDRTPDLDHVPLLVQYAVPSLPPGAEGIVSMDAQCATSGRPDGCGQVLGRVREPATGTYAISDASSAYSYGFETFVPGPGYIRTTLQVTWEPVTALQSVKITYNSYTESPIMWTAQ
jgi:hypothetical protein